MTGVLTFNNTTTASSNAIRFGPGPAANDDAHIEWIGGSNNGSLRISTSDDNGAEAIVFGDYDNTGRGGAFTTWLTMNRSTFTWQGNTIWHAGNDGTGSGLDADTVDGVEASAIVQTSGNQNIGGTKTFSSTISGTISNAQNLDNLDSTAFLRANANNDSASGRISTSGTKIEAGRGTGSVAMTTNDGYGNANLCFNHDAGTPDISGSSARIESSVDSSTQTLTFEVGNSTTGGTAVNLTTKMTINTSSVTVSGNFNATGEITAYSSDQRLKENLRPIDNAIDKVKSLNGLYFDWKPVIDDLGFEPDNKVDDAGVLAQEVQAVLPQAVTYAPFDTYHEVNEETGEMERHSHSGEDYLTVKYEKMVPLLIEAIKEQQDQIDNLKEMVRKLTDK